MFFLFFMQRFVVNVRSLNRMELAREQLIAGCRKGYHASQLALYNRYAQWLYNVCFRILSRADEAEEAMQDTFLKIYTRIGQFKEEHSFEAWMKSIAIHTAIDYVRKQQAFFESVEELPDSLSTDEYEEDLTGVTVQKVKDSMQMLPDGYRVVLSLYLFEGYDTEEIAQILDVKAVTVRSQYMRAKRKLEELLKATMK